LKFFNQAHLDSTSGI